MKEGLQVEFAKLDDDCGIPANAKSRAGCRGIAGFALVAKVCDHILSL